MFILCCLYLTAPQKNDNNYIGGAYKISLLLLLFLLIGATVNSRGEPPKNTEQLYTDLVAEIKRHHSAGKTILLSNVTTPYIDAGLSQPMRHRSNTELEIKQGGLHTLYSSADAFSAKEYDIVIVNAIDWYSTETKQALKENYHEIKRFNKLSAARDYQSSLLNNPFIVLETN